MHSLPLKSTEGETYDVFFSLSPEISLDTFHLTEHNSSLETLNRLMIRTYFDGRGIVTIWAAQWMWLFNLNMISGLRDRNKKKRKKWLIHEYQNRFAIRTVNWKSAHAFTLHAAVRFFDVWTDFEPLEQYSQEFSKTVVATFENRNEQCEMVFHWKWTNETKRNERDKWITLK